MMNVFMKSIYKGFRNIKLIGNKRSDRRTMNVCGETSVGRIQRLEHCNFAQDVLGLDSADLLIIDIDSFGVDEVRYMIFLASCFSPDLPLVLITGNILSKLEKQYLMNTGRVLDVIGCPRAENAYITA